MRIEGVSSSYIPNSNTRAHSSAPMAAAVAQVDKSREQRQQQGIQAANALSLDVAATVQRPSAQSHIQLYEARQTLNNPAQQYHASLALASYSSVASFSLQAEAASHVFGLDVYA